MNTFTLITLALVGVYFVWLALFGLPGILIYKTVNTADSMIGHRNARYESFGWAAARLDDFLNLAPARLAGGLLALSATINPWLGALLSVVVIVIAYLVAGDPGWRTARMTKIYDLSDPAQPKFIRNFALVGQQPGSSGENVPEDTHGPIVVGNRVYFGYGTLLGGVPGVPPAKIMASSTTPVMIIEDIMMFLRPTLSDMPPAMGAAMKPQICKADMTAPAARFE